MNNRKPLKIFNEKTVGKITENIIESKQAGGKYFTSMLIKKYVGCSFILYY